MNFISNMNHTVRKVFKSSFLLDTVKLISKKDLSKKNEIIVNKSGAMDWSSGKVKDYLLDLNQ